jgi:hypothetical protein
MWHSSSQLLCCIRPSNFWFIHISSFLARSKSVSLIIMSCLSVRYAMQIRRIKIYYRNVNVEMKKCHTIDMSANFARNICEEVINKILKIWNVLFDKDLILCEICHASGNDRKFTKKLHILYGKLFDMPKGNFHQSWEFWGCWTFFVDCFRENFVRVVWRGLFVN